MRQDNRRLWELVLLLSRRSEELELEKLEVSSAHVGRRLQYALPRFRELLAAIPPGLGSPAHIMQWEIAHFLGVSEEAVSRELRSLRARGVTTEPLGKRSGRTSP